MDTIATIPDCCSLIITELDKTWIPDLALLTHLATYPLVAHIQESQVWPQSGSDCPQKETYGTFSDQISVHFGSFGSTPDSPAHLTDSDNSVPRAKQDSFV